MRVRRVMMSADAVGGVWTYALELAAGLAERGIRVLLATLGPAPSASQRQQARAIPGLELQCADYPLEWAQGAMPAQAAAGDWLLALAQQWRPDIVHLNHYGHGQLPWPAPSLVVAHSCVLSWFEHVRGESAGADWSAYRAAVTQGLRAAPLVVAPSRAMLEDVRRLYGPLAATRVIHNGRRAGLFAPRSKRPYVLAAGRLWDEAKNVRVLQHAASSLPWPIQVAGELDHPDGGSCAVDGLHPLGVLDEPAMAVAFGHASIYVLPARYEPFGLSALEAAAAGCALVLGDIPSLRELWDGAAEFASPDDPAAVRDAIARLIDDPELRRQRAQAAQSRARRFSAARMVRHYLDAYAALRQPSELSACMS